MAVTPDPKPANAPTGGEGDTSNNSGNGSMPPTAAAVPPPAAAASDTTPSSSAGRSMQLQQQPPQAAATTTSASRPSIPASPRLPPPPPVSASGATMIPSSLPSSAAGPTTPGAAGATCISINATTSTRSSSGRSGIPPILGRPRSLSHGQPPLSSPLGRHRIALGAVVPTPPASARCAGTPSIIIGGPGSPKPPAAPFLPNLNPASSPCSPVPPVGIPAHTIPGGGTLPGGTPSPARSKAVEHALEAERLRVKDLQLRERDMDAAGLRVALRRERQHSQRLAGDLAALWSSAVQSQAEAEISEENRINGLMRRLDRVQREKGRIIVELEREEEMLTNTLQKKLNEVRREKALLEQQIEREHEEQARLARRQQDAHVTRGVAGSQDSDNATASDVFT